MHQWSYLETSLAGESQVGPIPESEFVSLVKQGKVKPKTKVASTTRTKGQWYEARQVPAVVKLFEQIAANEQELQRVAKEEKHQQKLERKAAKEASKATGESVEQIKPAKRIKPAVERGSKIDELDLPTKIALGVSGFALLMLCVSPFFKWMKFGAGGVLGISGDGKFLLGITVLAIGILVLALVKQKLLTPAMLTIQAWGTLCVFWLGALIWRVGAVVNELAMENPFAGLLASQFSPGAGLYIGLVGGLMAAVAFGFVAIRRLVLTGQPKAYLLTQGLACLFGVLLAFAMGPERNILATSQQSETAPSSLFAGAFGQVSEAATRAKWINTHNVTDEQVDQMVDNFVARQRPEWVSKTDWWEIAHGKSPAELNKLYPPLEPHEWYRVSWSESRSRELDRKISFGDKEAEHYLTLRFDCATPPDVPIKELYGILTFSKEGKVVYTTDVAEKPDVSFSDYHYLRIEIDPYDDNDEIHRTLRYAEDSELTLEFSVTRVVFPDGTEQVFGG